jgi:hypothetical protein
MRVIRSVVVHLNLDSHFSRKDLRALSSSSGSQTICGLHHSFHKKYQSTHSTHQHCFHQNRPPSSTSKTSCNAPWLSWVRIPSTVARSPNAKKSFSLDELYVMCDVTLDLSIAPGVFVNVRNRNSAYNNSRWLYNVISSIGCIQIRDERKLHVLYEGFLF